MTLRLLVTRARLGAAMAILLTIAPLQIAQAEEIGTQERAVFGTQSFPCLREAYRLINMQFLNITPDRVLDNLRAPLGKDAAWKKGDPNYDKVRAIVLAGVSDEIAQSWPMFEFSAGRFLADIVAHWTPDQQRHYAAFFASPAGKLYLSEMIEGGACHGLLRTIEQAPFDPLTGSEKTGYDALLAATKSDQQRYLNQVLRLSAEEQNRMRKEMAPLKATLRSVISGMTSQVDPRMTKRLEAVVAARLDDISNAANAH